jgi:uncharacterized LabA/DUF88 family protein
MVVGREKRLRQEAYLAALKTQPLIEIIVGRYKAKDRLCGVTDCDKVGNRTFPSLEEKRTDVAIGVHMIDDAYRDLCDVLIVVSGDSDLVPAVDMVRTRFTAKEVSVYVPTRNPSDPGSTELRQAATRSRDLPTGVFKHAQFPDRIELGQGRAIAKPPGW